ncbi:MAG TPA: DoxX family protein [Burkholderiaceae bacterium]|nr:DoxX family protein [Burkholderiaceae bacterium]
MNMQPPHPARQLATRSRRADRYGDLLLLTSRILMALIFVAAGADKIGRYGATVAMMEAAGVSGVLLPAVIALELGGGLAILLGASTRLAATALAMFCVVSAILFHHHLGDATQAAMFMKNLAMAGGFLALAVAGAGTISIDARQRPARTGPP